MKRLFLCFCTLSLFITPATAQDKPAATSVVTPQPSIYPLDIAVTSDGDLLIADRQLPGIRTWSKSDNRLSILAQGTRQFRTPLNATRTVAIDQNGAVLVGDTATREVYRLTDDGKPEPITGGKIGIPMDIAVKKDGTIYVADLELRKLVRIPVDSGDVEYVADVNPRGVFVDQEQNVWVVSQDAQQLLIVSDNGEVEPVVGERTFNMAHQVAVNKAGEAYVTDGYEKAIWKVTRGAKPEVWFKGAPLDNPVGICLVDDLPVVVDPRAAKIFKFDADAKPTVLVDLAK